MNFLTAFGVAMSIGVCFLGSHLPLYDSPQETKATADLYSNFLGRVPPINTQPIENGLRTVDKSFQSSHVADGVYEPLSKALGCFGSYCSKD